MNYYKELLLLKQVKGIGNVKINKEYVPLLKKGLEYDSLLEKLHEKYDSTIINEAIEKSNEIIFSIKEREDIEIITVFDSIYPSRLLDMNNDKPPIIYLKGNKNIIDDEGIAVVGTREPSEKSILMNKALINKIVNDYNFNIISGLAIGCDEIAHKETLVNKGKAVAVLPSGFDKIAPAKNKDLANDIIENGGCLISEYEPNVVANKSNFIKRDAIIAALADSVLIVECGVKSGTMHTVKYADKINRKIACCYPENLSCGNFDGNEYIIENYDSIKIGRVSDLQKVFNLKENMVREEQLTIMGL